MKLGAWVLIALFHFGEPRATYVDHIENIQYHSTKAACTNYLNMKMEELSKTNKGMMFDTYKLACVRTIEKKPNDSAS